MRQTTLGRRGQWRTRRIGWALLAGLVLAWFVVPLSAVQAHAELVSSSPAAGSLLPISPTVVKLTFSEAINPGLSAAVVLNAANTKQKINTEPSSAVSDTEIDIPLKSGLPSGNYLVVWRSVSTDDGHILEDAFCFAVANANGARPTGGTCVLPSGAIPGLGASATKDLSPSSLLSALGTWLAELATLAFVGGLLWQIVVLRIGSGLPLPAHDARGISAAARRGAVQDFEQRIIWLLGAVLLGNILLLLGNVFQTGAAFSVGLQAILVRSQFGTYWFLRQIAALVGLLALVLLPFGGLPEVRAGTTDISAAKVPPERVTPNAFAFAMPGNSAGTPGGASLSAAATASEQHLLLRDAVLLAAGLLLIFALAMSGHAASVTGPLAPYSVPVDVLHLLATSAWVGGIFYIAAALLPAIARTAPAERGVALVNLLPLFSPLAYVSVIILTLAGIFNTDAHLTSLDQFVTTGYGRALFVKLALVAAMIAISAWHVFRLRPQLSAALSNHPAHAGVPEIVARFARWLRIEAGLGVGVVLCVALMAALAGSLGASASSTKSQPVVLKQTTANGTAVTIAFTSTKAGSQPITIALKDSAGQPITDPNAKVTIVTTIQDMFMGTQTYPAPYVADDHDYAGTVDFLMSGHWQLVINITTTVKGQLQKQQATFTILAQ